MLLEDFVDSLRVPLHALSSQAFPDQLQQFQYQPHPAYHEFPLPPAPAPQPPPYHTSSPSSTTPSSGMQSIEPPPVTRLVPEDLIAAANLPPAALAAASRFDRDANSSLLCSESETEFTAACSADRGKLSYEVGCEEGGGVGGLPKPQLQPLLMSAAAVANPANASNFIPPRRPVHHQPNPNTTVGKLLSLPSSRGDYRTPSALTSKQPFHIPLTIAIPAKVRLPPQMNGKRTNQFTYKPHPPGNGLLKIGRQPEAPADLGTATMNQPYTTPLGAGDSNGYIAQGPGGVATMMSNHGIVNIISSNEPGTKVPTPPCSLLSLNSLSTCPSSSSSSSTQILTSTDDPCQTAMAMTSLSLIQPTYGEASGAGKSKKSKKRPAIGGVMPKKRTSFSRVQVMTMEKRFEQQRYLTCVERREFAASIGLDDNHVKVWFQNRRSKAKRQTEVTSSSGTTAGDGSALKKCPLPPCPKQPAEVKYRPAIQQVSSGMMSVSSSSTPLSSSSASLMAYEQAMLKGYGVPFNPPGAAPAQSHIPAVPYSYAANANGNFAPTQSCQNSSGSCMVGGTSLPPMNMDTNGGPALTSAAGFSAGSGGYPVQASSGYTQAGGVSSATVAAVANYAPSSFSQPIANHAPTSMPCSATSTFNNNYSSSLPISSQSPFTSYPSIGIPALNTSYGYRHDYERDHCSGVVNDQASKSLMPSSAAATAFGFPFSPGFGCHFGDPGFNSMMPMPILNSANCSM